MYVDKDSNGNISIMEISEDELNDFCDILTWFEFFIAPGKPEGVMHNIESGRLAMFSTKVRFKIADALKLFVNKT